MKRSEIYKAILEDVFKRMHDNGVIDDDDYGDSTDYILAGEFSNIECESLQSDYKAVVKAIVDWDGSNDIEIIVGNEVYYEKAVDEQLDYYREISVYSESSRFALISASNLYRDIQTGDVNTFLRNIELVWSVISGNNNEKELFWMICNIQDEKAFYIITDEQLSTHEEKWNAYSYGYLLYANAESYERDSQLDFLKVQKFISTVTYNKTNQYCQYFELFDLISESHYCDDILRRYLNMYQIIVNMCYRRNLAKISHGSKRGFVRHTIAVASKANKNETDEIVKGIIMLFFGMKNVIAETDINPYDSFLEREYGITKGGHSDKKIAKIVYNIRNSIVHNKSTELHFSYGNIDEYRDIIGLVRLLIEKFEPKIIEIINNPNNKILEFDSKKKDLY